MNIRKATLRDTSTIIKLLGDLGRPRPKTKSDMNKFARLVHKFISDRNSIILVAEKDSTIIGMVSLVLVPRLNQTRPELWIADMIVSKDHQSKGIGKKLVMQCKTIAKKKNCFRIRLESGNNRKRTHRFYKKAGFEQYALSFKRSM